MERKDEEKIIKKRYLRSYREHVHRRERLEEQLVELQAIYGGKRKTGKGNRKRKNEKRKILCRDYGMHK